ncbi:MAG: hypothetical protein H7308_02045 [Chthonomonadaceae bacterium]|nr:hypothetical protein [Chthonomonadaceae bacterium]
MKSIAFFALTLALIPLQSSLSALPDKPGQEKSSSSRGRIDWNKGTLFATGLGAINRKEGDDAKSYLRARSFARMDARRNLLAIIDSVKIDSMTTGQDYEAQNETIREQISGLLKGTEIVSERTITIGNGKMVEVTVSMPLYGENGLSSVYVPEIVERNRMVLPSTTPEDTSEDALEIPRLPAPADPPKIFQPREDVGPAHAAISDGPITAVIIDARGMNVERSMSPKIRRRDGSEVWGTLKVSPEFVIDQGIVAYATSMGDAKKNRRVGGNPLVIKAAGRTGGRFTTDVVITDEDADTLLQSNKKDGFLKEFRVVSLLDPGK